MVHHYPENVVGRDFVIGDLHGHFDLFLAFLDRLEVDPERDRVFSVGDLIDRGPKSADAIRATQAPWFKAVRGNHEQMLIDVVSGKMAPNLWLVNGGEWALDTPMADLKEILKLAETLPHAISIGEGAARFNVLHGEFFGSDEDLDAGRFIEERILWGRDLISGRSPMGCHTGLSPTYCGHSCVTRIKRVEQQIFIDTGCGHPNGKLTIIEPKTNNSWQIQ